MQISTVTTLMRMARDKGDFEDLFERAFPPTQPRLPLIVDVPPELGEARSRIGVFSQRFAAAFLAISERCSAVSFDALALRLAGALDNARSISGVGSEPSVLVELPPTHVVRRRPFRRFLHYAASIAMYFATGAS